MLNKKPVNEARPLGTPNPKGRKPGRKLKFVQTSAPAVPMVCPRCKAELPDGDAGKRECQSCYWREVASPEPVAHVDQFHVYQPHIDQHEDFSPEPHISTCAEQQLEVGLLQSDEPTQTPIKAMPDDSKVKNMKLSLKTGERKGSSVVYTVEGRRGTVKFAAALFEDASNAPAEIEIDEEGFAEPKKARAKLSKEERAALPKPSLADKLKSAEAKAAKLRAKLETQAQPAL